MNSLKKIINKGTVSVGSWVTIGHSAIAEIMARSGFEWIVVDLEHSVITIREAGDLIRTIDLCGIPAIVRLSANDPVQVKRVLDAGAHGIIVPMVNSAEDARNAVSAVHYPPRGERGVGLSRAQGYGADFEKYRQWLEKNIVVIVQIEHINAVDNFESILKVEGVDGFIVGPYDLSGSLGIPGKFGDPLMKDTMEKIRKVGMISGKVPGIHVVEPDKIQLNQRIDQGYRFIAYSLDIRMLDICCREIFQSGKIG